MRAYAVSVSMTSSRSLLSSPKICLWMRRVSNRAYKPLNAARLLVPPCKQVVGPFFVAHEDGQERIDERAAAKVSVVVHPVVLRVEAPSGLHGH